VADDPGEITLLLNRMAGGDRTAEEQLVPLVYGDLRRMAQHNLSRERPNHSLQATALVHEAYLRLTGQKEIDWQNRGHFLAVAARVMRRVLVDHARSVKSIKRAGVKVDLDSALVYSAEQSWQILALDDALTRLGEWDARQARIVEMRFFTGLSEEEIASLLGLSARTVKRDWRLARAWLYGELTRSGADVTG